MPAGCIPPYSVKCQPCHPEICTVNPDCGGREWVLTEQRRGKGYEPDGQEEDDIDPQENPVSPFDVMKLVVVANPIHAQYDKTESIDENIRRKSHDFKLKA